MGQRDAPDWRRTMPAALGAFKAGRAMPDDLSMRHTARREPLFNAPWPVVALVFSLLATHLLRVVTGVDPDPFALTRDDLDNQRWLPLISYMFVHGNWAHVGMNSAFTLAFGAPVARCLGAGWRGASTFFVFFLVCGMIAAIGYAGLIAAIPLPGDHSGWALVGASGAASGLMGAAARLIQGRGRIGSIGGRVVVSMTLSWIAINAILGLSGLTPGAGAAPVAWQAHIVGFAAGLLLISPALWLAKGSRADHE
jgi:membrane associated rhomboid family serine protease